MVPKVPQYNPNVCFNKEFYSLLVKNHELLKKISQVDFAKQDTSEKIYNIVDYYDKHILRLTNERYKQGMSNKIRKFTHRKKNEDLERNQTCPYESCSKVYNTECALSNHIKLKHNGGTKTDRENLAKGLIMFKLQGGLKMPDKQLKYNLPPGIIRSMAKELIDEKPEYKDSITDEIIEYLEDKLLEYNRNEIQRIKE